MPSLFSETCTFAALHSELQNFVPELLIDISEDSQLSFLSIFFKLFLLQKHNDRKIAGYGRIFSSEGRCTTAAVSINQDTANLVIYFDDISLAKLLHKTHAISFATAQNFAKPRFDTEKSPKGRYFVGKAVYNVWIKWSTTYWKSEISFFIKPILTIPRC